MSELIVVKGAMADGAGDGVWEEREVGENGKPRQSLIPQPSSLIPCIQMALGCIASTPRHCSVEGSDDMMGVLALPRPLRHA